MKTLLKHWADSFLNWLGLTAEQSNGIDRWVAFVIVLLAIVLIDYLLRLVVVWSVTRIVQKTRVRWDDDLFSPDVLRAFCHIVSAVLLIVVLPVVFEVKSEAHTIVKRLTEVYLVVTVFRFVNASLYAIFRLAVERPAWQNKPIKGLRQTGQGIAALVCGILIVSILLDKSPAIFLTGLGASAAIVLLIFRDSILGFVSGIQLSANDMLQVGDWISVPKYGADGTVEEVSLNTVKIRNFDNTIVTLPPYLLVSESFQNWRAMQLSGGRRVMRSVSIDMSSVRFCTADMLEKYRTIDLIREYVDQTERRIEAYNAEHDICPGERRINGLHQTNLGVFRAYLVRYLQNEVPVNKNMTLMVRQLQPTETGLPVQLYFFTNTVEWVAYEGIQSDVFDHVLAVVREFDLRVFQNPAGSDIEALRGGMAPLPDPASVQAVQSVPQAAAESAAPPGTGTAPQTAESAAPARTGLAPEADAAPAGLPAASAPSEENHQHDLNDDHPKEHADGVDGGV